VRVAVSRVAVGRRLSAVGAMLCLAAGSALGQAPSAPAERSAVQWLHAIQAAARQSNYTGTIVYQYGDEVRSSRVIHAFDGHVSGERVQMLDGRPREVIRRGEQVECFYPQQRRIVIERAGRRAVFPELGDGGPISVLEHYALHPAEMERVAGLECQILRLEPKDALRYGYRLCIDPASGLLMKVQVLTGESAVVEQIAFSDVRIGEPISPAQLRTSYSTVGWRVERRESHEVDLSHRGWIVTAPEGFRRLTEVERMLGIDTQRSALQAVYSDGLATMSVFIETNVPPAESEGPPPQGPLSAVMRRVGDARVTVVGEVPPATARSFADSVRYVAVH
jgi:sigma-E factor negative regulatory protein RseB